MCKQIINEIFNLVQRHWVTQIGVLDLVTFQNYCAYLIREGEGKKLRNSYIYRQEEKE